MIIGCDFHPSWEQVSWLDTETRRDRGAEAGARHGRCGAVLSAGGSAGADRNGSDRQLSLAGGPAGGAGARVVGGRCGADPGQLRAAAEDGQAGRGAHSEAAGGRAVSAHLDAVERGARPAAVAVAPLQAGDHPDAGEERTATPLSQPGSAEEAQAVEPGGTAGAARVAAEALGPVGGARTCSGCWPCSTSRSGRWTRR